MEYLDLVENLEDVVVGGQFLRANVDVDVPEPKYYILTTIELIWRSMR